MIETVQKMENRFRCIIDFVFNGQISLQQYNEYENLFKRFKHFGKTAIRPQVHTVYRVLTNSQKYKNELLSLDFNNQVKEISGLYSHFVIVKNNN